MPKAWDLDLDKAVLRDQKPVWRYEMFSGFDAACAALGVEKIKTMGDAYLAAAGLPRSTPASDSGSGVGHIHAAADLALTMLSVVKAAGPPWRIRIGIHNVLPRRPDAG